MTGITGVDRSSNWLGRTGLFGLPVPFPDDLSCLDGIIVETPCPTPRRRFGILPSLRGRHACLLQCFADFFENFVVAQFVVPVTIYDFDELLAVFIADWPRATVYFWGWDGLGVTILWFIWFALDNCLPRRRRRT